MKILKYILLGFLVIWGILIAYSKLLFVGIHFPFLTVVTIIAIIIGIIKHEKADLIFIISACLWMVLSAETIGFVIFFDEGNNQRMIFGIIPFILSVGVLFTTQTKIKLINNSIQEIILSALLLLLGIGSYIYKPTTEEINCWYYLDNNKTNNVLFAKGPHSTFEVELSSDELKKEVIKDALQYEGLNGYYCPETKVRVVTSFGKIISAKIMSFRNGKINKKVKFSSPTIIPLEKVKGELEILKPFTLRSWN